ncbi:MAG: cbb3-type cytochrome c oxidase subunit 3 [Rickettsiales bacterium]
MISSFASVHLGMIGLLFFFAVFVGVVIWAYNPKRKKRIEDQKHIPLREEGE